MKQKKYTVMYSSTTGYGWDMDFERLDEFEDFINEHRYNMHTRLMVFDNTINKMIFIKHIWDEPKVDFLKDMFRDMRTTTRKAKN